MIGNSPESSCTHRFSGGRADVWMSTHSSNTHLGMWVLSAGPQLLAGQLNGSIAFSYSPAPSDLT